ncbi:MAG: polysaccharide deacetylase family protein [Bosea sp. (in: a-proteobacteria)]
MTASSNGTADALLPLRAELSEWQRSGLVARLWFRDDDAMAPTAALEHLIGLTRRHTIPLLLAVIPMRAEAGLAERLASETHIEVAMHGVWHRNYMTPEEKSQETPALRGLAVIAKELEAARDQLVTVFRDRSGTGDWYVPPWNRIPTAVAELLPPLGFKALSTFGATHHDVPGLAQLNGHVDLIDWRGGRIGRNLAWVARELASALTASRLGDKAPVGLLAHHLDHEEVTWSVLEQLGALIADHPAARWVSATEALS